MTTAPDSVEVMRRRARHRLIGAAVLVLLGVVGFPLLFDTQPRPLAVDIPITIPERNPAAPLALPEAVVPEAAGPAPVASSEGLGAGEELVASGAAATATAEPEPTVPTTAVTTPVATPTPVPAKSKPESKPEPKPKPKPVPKVRSETKPEAESLPKPPSRSAEAARARALLDGRAVDADSARIVVQVGAFADPDKAQEVRLRLERAGLKTYTHVADTKDGKRTRVRVGPFANRAEADRAAQKIKKLDLPASILNF